LLQDKKKRRLICSETERTVRCLVITISICILQTLRNLQASKDHHYHCHRLMNRNQFYSWFSSLQEIATANLSSISFSQIKKSEDIELNICKSSLLSLVVFRASSTEHDFVHHDVLLLKQRLIIIVLILIAFASFLQLNILHVLNLERLNVSHIDLRSRNLDVRIE